MTDFTTKAIKESFMKLINEKPINQITIKDITSNCSISRNTFYYHFEDMPSLVEEIIMDMANEIISEYPTIDSFEHGLQVGIEFAMKNKRAAMHIFNSHQRDIYERCLMKVCNHVVRVYFDTVFKKSKLSNSEKELMINFYKCACFGIIVDWCDSGMKEESAEKFKQMCELRRGMVESFFGIK